MPLDSAQNFFTNKDFLGDHHQTSRQGRRGLVQEQGQGGVSNLVGLEDAEFTRSYSQFKILKATAWAVGGCGLLLGGLGVANTMIMSVFTRIREIAILRVCGFSNTQIAAMIFGESAVVSMLARRRGCWPEPVCSAC